MLETPFIITIDTEGDDLWARPRRITTRNAEYLPRFQALCERYGFRPVYLTNYEMAMSEAFVEFGRDLLERNTGEIGMHLHAWNSPPLIPLTGDDFRFQPYLIEYPDAVMRQKIHVLTAILEERFERNMISHRAGRWGFDGRYAAMLLDEGYGADCSVTPGVDWSRATGDPAGTGGPDYTAFPYAAYFLDPADISSPAADGLLEVPMTVCASRLHRKLPWAYRVPVLRGAANRVSLGLRWLCPAESSLEAMLQAARGARSAPLAHLEFMLHSSQLMPGGSPGYRSASSIEQLYDEMETLFAYLAPWCRGTTLEEFHAQFAKPARPAPSLRALPHAPTEYA